MQPIQYNMLDLNKAFLQVRKFLPVQGPIKDFIHLNILEKFMNEPFHDAIKTAGKAFNAHRYLSFSYYREKFNKNEIKIDDILYILNKHYPNKNNEEINILLENLLNYRPKTIKNENAFPIRSSLFKKINANLDHIVNPILFRLLSSYLDQGVSLWHFLDRSSFAKAVEELASSSKIPLAYFISNKELAKDLNENIDEKIISTFKKIFDSEDYFFDFLKESLVVHRGWSGMVDIVEKRKKSLTLECNINLKEFFLVKILFEWQAIKYFKKNFLPLTINEIEINNINNDYENELLMIWHESMETNYYKKIFAILSQKPKLEKEKFKYQAIFCIDDRECSFRRILEWESADVETFGTAGFFGIDTYLFSQKKGLVEKICPVPIEPEHIISQRQDDDDSYLTSMANFITRHGANSFLLGFLSIHTLGHLSLFGLLASFSHPQRLLFSKRKNQKMPTYINFIRDEKEPKIFGKLFGYSIDEMAERVFRTLNGIDLTCDFKELIFFIGHGSSSMNNPHYAAYDCGACSGRPGRVSARVISSMANHPKVREKLKEKGINIPHTTVFIPAYHDTCTDEIEYYDIDNLTKEQFESFDKFKNTIKNVQKKNAFERCKKFILAKNVTLETALNEVKLRSRAIFEPRPELGHQLNALLVVGRRERTYKLNLEHRSFLQSYNPLKDQDGNVLLSLLSAAIPVCGGINLDYFFSRIDPSVYGSGSKLSHNVTSLVGVGHGLDDDLRTGLPIQMSELHDPIRLLVVVEQEIPMLLSVIKKNPNVFLWVKNFWVRLAALDPYSDKLVMINEEMLA